MEFSLLNLQKSVAQKNVILFYGCAGISHFSDARKHYSFTQDSLLLQREKESSIFEGVYLCVSEQVFIGLPTCLPTSCTYLSTYLPRKNEMKAKCMVQMEIIIY